MDPEDVQMHYTLMLCYRGLGDKDDGGARGEAVPPLQGRRILAVDHRQAPRCSAPKIITSGSRFTITKASLKATWCHEAAGGVAGVIVRVRAMLADAAAAPSGCAVRVFTDVTAAAGIHFVHNSGRAGKKYLPETLGSGCAFFDADGDGWPDILLVNSKDWTPRGRRSLRALYRNNHNGTFTDITAGSGLDVEMYGMGVAVADYDNDGRDDVYITALEGDHLFHNEGNGKFRDVTKAAGIQNANFGTSAAWLDYDRDGKLDLFVANYVQWTPKADLWCSLDGATKSYCTPESYKGTRVAAVPQPGRRQVRGRQRRRPAWATPPASRWA